jgi:AcrR family transcriptional regulator
MIDVATRHFMKQGFEGASLNEILAESEICKGSFYYYFEDKEGLFATALEQALAAVMELHPSPPLQSLTRERFWPAVEDLLAGWATAFEPLSELFQGVLRLSEEQRRSPRLAAVLNQVTLVYREIIASGQRLGCVRTDLSPDVLVRLIEVNDAALDSMLFAAHTPMSPGRLGSHARLVFDTIHRLLVADPHASASPVRQPRSKPPRQRRSK